MHTAALTELFKSHGYPSNTALTVTMISMEEAPEINWAAAHKARKQPRCQSETEPTIFISKIFQEKTSSKQYTVSVFKGNCPLKEKQLS